MEPFAPSTRAMVIGVAVPNLYPDAGVRRVPQPVFAWGLLIIV